MRSCRRSLSHGSHHFGVLIQRHSNYLFALAMRMTKGQHALAEDVVQQSFLNAFSRLKSFDRKRDFSWLADRHQRELLPRYAAQESAV